MGNRFRAWWRQHAYSLVYSVGNISRRPVAVAMTAATLGVALALPLLLRVALLNFEAVETVRPLEGISVFLVQQADGATAREFARRVGGWPRVERVELTSPEAGLETFMDAGGLGAAAAELSENPLPWVVGVMPKTQSPAAVAGLVERLRDEAVVASARADLRWLQRLRGMLDLARSVALGLGLLFALAVLLVVFNTTGTEVMRHSPDISCAIVSPISTSPAMETRRPTARTSSHAGAWAWPGAGGPKRLPARNRVRVREMSLNAFTIHWPRWRFWIASGPHTL